ATSASIRLSHIQPLIRTANHNLPALSSAIVAYVKSHRINVKIWYYKSPMVA
ncbi:hypothetical protein EG68_12194, partial [Paragonimus skrjabini miyazakii]